MSDNRGNLPESSVDINGSAAQTELALAAALDERTRLWKQAHRAHALERELGEVRSMVADMESSLSWRITLPLRQAKATVVRYADLARRARTRTRGG